MPELLDQRRPQGGRPGGLSSRHVLLGLLLAIDAGRPAHLAAGWRALEALDRREARRLGLGAAPTYRQFSGTYQVMTRAIDPTPVPSFKGVADHARSEHLAAARAAVDDEEAAAAALAEVVDRLVGASVPEHALGDSHSLAIDWTDHETWARPRERDDPMPCADPDASWGHAKRNAPGAADHLFFGYYAQTATMVKDEGREPVTEFILRIAFAAPRVDPPTVMAATLVRAAAQGFEIGDVLADCGYSNRRPEHFAAPLRATGANFVFDLHPEDRGPRGTHQGAIVCNGNLYCPATPRTLLELGPIRTADPDKRRAHEEQCAELARYKLGRQAGPDAEGYARVMCPAAMGKVRCPLQPASMQRPFHLPEVLSPPEQPPCCCTQQTITVAPHVLAKTGQKHDYPSKAHANSYPRRVAAERTFAGLADPSVIGIRRGWSRLFGLAKNMLLYALAAIVRNVRLEELHERRRAEAARKAALGLDRPGRRRRRRRRNVTPSPPPQPEEPTGPD